LVLGLGLSSIFFCWFCACFCVGDKMSRLKAVVFDRDGVLTDTEIIHVKSAKKAFDEFGITLSEEDEKRIIARNPIDYLPELQEKYELSDELIERIHSREKKIFTNLFKQLGKLSPGAKELINFLKNNGIKLVLATSSGKSNILFLNMFNLNNIFDFMLTENDVIKRKPNPEIYIKAKKMLGFNDDEIIVIEDSEVGVEAAKSAGLKCIALKNEFTKHKNSKADYVVNDLYEAKKIIEKLI